jgi:hypothetical protein
MEMIRSPHKHVSVVSESSLSAFILKIEMPPKSGYHPRFFGINESYKGFTTPIYSIILKLVAISDSMDKLPEHRGNITRRYHDKISETYYSFCNEAKTQQLIYTATLSPCGKPVTLAICDFQALRPHGTTEFLDLLRTDENGHIMDYLHRQVVDIEHRQLGVIAMELAHPGAYTFGEADALLSDAILRNTMRCHAIAQLVLLFLRMKIVHCDCHINNVMYDPEENKTVIIDFGKTIDMKLLRYINKKYRDFFRRDIHTDYGPVGNIDISFFHTHGAYHHLRTLHEIITMIVRIDAACQRGGKPQCNWIPLFLYGNEDPFPSLTETAINKLEEVLAILIHISIAPMHGRNAFSVQNISELLRQGELLKIKDCTQVEEPRPCENEKDSCCAQLDGAFRKCVRSIRSQLGVGGKRSRGKRSRGRRSRGKRRKGRAAKRSRRQRKVRAS